MQSVNRRGGWRTARSLLIGLAILMVLSPLGLRATGTAWGEWAPEDFSTPEGRQAIANASGGQLPPGQGPGSAGGSGQGPDSGGTPAGLDRLSSFWTAPIPDYAPPFMQSETFGYILSAVFGTGLIILAFLLISWVASLLRGGRDPDPTSQRGAGTV